MQAIHLMADLYRCRCDRAWLEDAAPLRTAASQVLDACGARSSDGCFVPLEQGGVAGALLSEHAQLSLRTSPAERSVALDLWMASSSEQDGARARHLMEALAQLFEPEWTEQRSLDRGEDA